MNEFEAEYLSDGYIKVKKNSNIEIKNSSGSSEPGRIKFKKFFYVKYEKAKFENDFIIFKKSDVMKVNPTVSVHITLNKSKEEIIDYFNSL